MGCTTRYYGTTQHQLLIHVSKIAFDESTGCFINILCFSHIEDCPLQNRNSSKELLGCCT